MIQIYQLDTAVLKAQIHAGGRGKAGGIKFAHNRQEILSAARELLGKRFINNQTGKEGMVAHQILITFPIPIIEEYYLGAIIDRKRAQGVLIASPEGGMEIEQVAHQTPEKVLTLLLPIDGLLKPYQLLRVAKFMRWEGSLAAQGMQIISSLVKAFVETDASLIEINPLVKTEEGKLTALDAKLSVDDNALFRQPLVKSFFDPNQVSQSEARAQQHELAYVALEGDIGCMVNGAGLAMATMDIIHYNGGTPANFLDVGGGASKEKVAEGFRIILSDPKVKVILINIFGGIMNCETLAAGIIAAACDLHIHVPLVVRMEGTHVEQGKKLLETAGLSIKIADSLEEAAQQAVSIAKAL